jgi:hypothetical protein
MPDEPKKKVKRQPMRKHKEIQSSLLADETTKNGLLNLVKRNGAYHAGFAELARRLALFGASNDIMASIFGVGHNTFAEWLKKHPLLAAAVESGRIMADATVAHSLYERAIGESVVYKEREALDKEGDIHVLRSKEQLPPDVHAQIFWLKNRAKDKWQDRVEANVTGEVQQTIVQIIRSSRQDSPYVDVADSRAVKEPIFLEPS